MYYRTADRSCLHGSLVVYRHLAKDGQECKTNDLSSSKLYLTRLPAVYVCMYVGLGLGLLGFNASATARVISRR